MELDELHVLECSAGEVGERLSVAGVLPAVRRDAVGAADSARGHDHGLGAEHLEASALAIIGECACYSLSVLQQGDDGAFHVHVEPLMNAVILERADHLEPRAIADVCEAWIPVSAEVA